MGLSFRSRECPCSLKVKISPRSWTRELGVNGNVYVAVFAPFPGLCQIRSSGHLILRKKTDGDLCLPPNH